jgi:iron complex outermembrane receptor protein
LEPESAWEYEIGVIQEFKPITARVALFYYDIHNFMNDNGVTAPGTGLGSDCLYNVDHYKLYGGELELALRLGDNFRATAAYVYQENEMDDTGYEESWTYYLPELLPKHKVKLTGQYRVWKDGWLLASARYVADREAQKGSSLGDYAVLDLGFEQGFKYGWANYRLKLFCNNAFDTDYEEQAGYEMPGQVVGAELSLSF